MDVVVTVPKDRWNLWVSEGDLPGVSYDGRMEYIFWTSTRPKINPGEGLRRRPWCAPRLRAALVRWSANPPGLIRRGGAVAVSIDQQIDGFRGWRYRWWEREAEVPFPAWREPLARVGAGGQESLLVRSG